MLTTRKPEAPTVDSKRAILALAEQKNRLAGALVRNIGSSFSAHRAFFTTSPAASSAGPGHWSPCVSFFDFGFCILTFEHCGHCHLRCLWNRWPFSSFIVTLHFLQVMAAQFHLRLIR
jgi:hypothetical protein